VESGGGATFKKPQAYRSKRKRKAVLDCPCRPEINIKLKLPWHQPPTLGCERRSILPHVTAPSSWPGSTTPADKQTVIIFDFVHPIGPCGWLERAPAAIGGRHRLAGSEFFADRCRLVSVQRERKSPVERASAPDLPDLSWLRGGLNPRPSPYERDMRRGGRIVGYGLDPIMPVQSTLLNRAGGTRSASEKSKPAMTLAQ
jgi:hypothetical protein